MAALLDTHTFLWFVAGLSYAMISPYTAKIIFIFMMRARRKGWN